MMLFRRLTKQNKKNLEFKILENLFRFGFLNKRNYIKLLFKKRMGYKCDLFHPVTFNEKLQWLKLNAINPDYTRLADKVKLKEFVREKLGEEYVVPTLGIWNKPEEINFDELPSNYIIKCNHGSGSLFSLLVDETITKEEIITKLKNGLKINYYYHAAEYPYKNIERKIIAEKILLDESGKFPPDYKVYCFNGVPKIILVCIDRFGNPMNNFYDVNWEKLDLQRRYPNCENFKLPSKKILNKLLETATILSESIPFVRVDCYLANNNIYVGEMTFHPLAGCVEFNPPIWDTILGGYLNL